MPSFMLDTDICSYIMKRRNPRILERLEKMGPGDVCISAIAKSELMFGVAISPRQEKDRAALDDFLHDLPVLDYPGEASLAYAEIRGWLKVRGTPIGSNDLLIAAHARYLNVTLVTNNTKEFLRVPGLKIENWADPVV